MARCQMKGCNGTLRRTGKAKAVCSVCGTRHKELTFGNWLAEPGKKK